MYRRRAKGRLMRPPSPPHDEGDFSDEDEEEFDEFEYEGLYQEHSLTFTIGLQFAQRTVKKS